MYSDERYFTRSCRRHNNWLGVYYILPGGVGINICNLNIMRTHVYYLTIIAALLVGFYCYEVHTPNRISVISFNDGTTEINYETLLFGWQSVETNTQDCDDAGQCLEWWEPEIEQTPQNTNEISWTPENLIQI